MMDGYTPSYSTWVISTNYNCPGALNKTFGNKVCFYRLIAGWWFPPRGQIKFKYCLKCQQRSITLRLTQQSEIFFLTAHLWWYLCVSPFLAHMTQRIMWSYSSFSIWLPSSICGN
jgi:hypothetical protein